MAKTIFITGASRGFGALWTEAFLKRGDKVVATARNIKSLDGLKERYGNSILTLQLDVNKKDDCIRALNEARDHFGSVDIVINNAGYSLFGAVEETSESQARNLMDTNFFGLLWITQAAIPIMRSQGHGHIIQISSVLGQTTLPTLALYNASKFAIEGLSESLAAEVKQFGIDITIIEPNGYATENVQTGVYAENMPQYDKLKKDLYGSFPEDAYGTPEATINPLLVLTDSSAPPLRLLLGKYALANIKQAYAQRLDEWDKWSELSMAAHGK